MRRALLGLLLVLVTSCSAAKVKPNTQGVLCVWPDPITFDGNADSWTVCFQVPPGIDPPICRTVGELRRMLKAQRAAN